MEKRGARGKIKEEGSAGKGWMLHPRLVAGGTDQEEPMGVMSVCATAGTERTSPRELQLTSIFRTKRKG